MRFGTVAVADAEGALLVHSLRADGVSLRKGHRLTRDDLRRLAAAGVADVIALVLDAGDVMENEAAARLAEALAAGGVRTGEAATGRVNLYAAHNGLFRVDALAVDAFNAIDPALTVATLKDRAEVAAGDMVATIKIIPLAVSAPSLDAGIAVLGKGDILDVKPLAAMCVGLVATELPSLKASAMDKTSRLLADRLRPSGSTIVQELRVSHETNAVAAALDRLKTQADMLIVFGASAVADPEDVIPAAIRAAGGTVESVGMPVDPGNLLVLGYLGDKPVIGAPGCARSPKENGFDWVLARLLAGETVKRADIAGLGVGGLLSEIPTRPQPRAQGGETGGEAGGEKTDAMSAPRVQGPRVHGVLLAAGRATRMGEGSGHKLLATFDGVPLIRRVAERALSTRLSGLTVVTGHRREDIEAALSGLAVEFTHNSGYADGMAGSIASGLAHVPPGEAALILLGDMPAVESRHIDALLDAFGEAHGEAVVRAASGRNRGNPVILPPAMFELVMARSGDVGARQAIADSGLDVIDVDIGEAAEVDVDTPEAVISAGGTLSG